jgi:hypothetical protein
MMPVASLDNSRILLIISEATSEHPSICRLAAGYSVIRVAWLQGCNGRRRDRPCAVEASAGILFSRLPPGPETLEIVLRCSRDSGMQCAIHIAIADLPRS